MSKNKKGKEIRLPESKAKQLLRRWIKNEKDVERIAGCKHDWN